MRKISLTNVVFCLLIIIGLCLFGCATSGRYAKGSDVASKTADKTVYYQSLSGTPGWNTSVKVSNVTIIANQDRITAEFAIKPIADLIIYKRPAPFNPQQNGIVKVDLAGLKDTVALLCMYSTSGQTFIPAPHILGVTHVHTKVADQVHEGSLYPVVVGDSIDQLFISEKESSGGIKIGGAITGFGRGSAETSKNYFIVWFLPNMPGNYDIVFSGGKVTLKLD